MRHLTARDLLEVWEVGEVQHPLDRALTLLAAACPESSWDELTGLSIGQRDARLLDLRERTCGPTLSGFVECPRCSERLEFDAAVSDLRPPESRGPREPPEMVVDGEALRFRPPDSRDLAAVAGCHDKDAAVGLLLRRCLAWASREETTVDIDRLPAGIVAELSERISEHDPQSEVLLDLRCPACGHAWQALFDILSFFWTEIAARASRLLREVHDLARAYGWSEAEILGMGDRRRLHYLGLAF